MDRQDRSADDDVDVAAAAAAHPFLFLAGDIALDFVNTVMVDGGGLVDRVAAPDQLAAWVAASVLGAEYGTPDAIPPTVHERALEVRRALKTGFDAVSTGEPVPDATVAALDAILARAPGTELSRGPEGALRHRLRVDLAKDSAALPWLLADAGARLLTSELTDRLRRCANHDTCVLVFLDTSRNRARRWCSMQLCGNRSKVAAHEARARRRRAKDTGATT